jgi:hypothetical protein
MRIKLRSPHPFSPIPFGLSLSKPLYASLQSFEN